jgi:hypothetical protein
LSDFNGSVDDFVENINKLASINASAIDNIKALSQLNASISSKIVSFFEKLAEVDFKKVNVEDFIKSLTKLGNIDAELLQNINNIT